jgi:trimeric autotransporter adhesin
LVNQERKKTMQKNSNRKGLALGAIFALVASLFATAPAAQANEAGLVVEPIVGTSYTMVNTEDFILSTRLGSQVQADRAGALKYIIEKSGTVGYGLSISHTVSPTTVATFPGELPSSTAGSTYSAMATTSTISVVATVNASGSISTKNQLRIQLWSFSTLTSMSPAASVDVTAFLDLNNDGLVNGTEPTTKVTISFVRLGAIGASIVLSPPTSGDTFVTASAQLTGVNYQQLTNGSSFNLGFLSTRDQVTAHSAASVSAVTGAALALGTYSRSERIDTATASALVAQSISAVLYYGTEGNNTIVAIQTLGVAGSFAFDGVTFSGTVGPNFLYTGSSMNAADIRVNSPVSLEAWAFTGSKAAVSATQASSMWFETSVTLSTEKALVVNGVTYTDSAKLPTRSSAVAIAAGTKAAIALSTVGFAANDTVTFHQRAVDKTASIVLTSKAPVFSLTSDSGLFAIVAPGASSAFAFEVTDQFDVPSARVNQRLAAYTLGTGFSASDTVSSNVVAGKASVTVTTLPAVQTGSAIARVTLQAQDIDTGTWVNVSGAQVNIALTVTTSPAVFKSAVSPSSSPVSISYKVHSWSDDVTVTTNVAGAVVTVTATGLVIKDVAGKVTASNSIVARSGTGGVLTLQFAGAKAGDYTVSYTVGSTTTTSQVVVQPAVVANASTVTFDKSGLVAGETNTVVATLVDANGNGIETVAANLVLAYSGKGLPFNLSADTDEDGKLTFQILVLAGETGAGKVTATIKPTGVTADNITVVKDLPIAAPAVVAAPEVNAVIGTFNGRWAVRVENAKGAVVSVKVGNRWVKYTSLNDNYLFSRKSRVGATVPVAVYVNGQLENVATITIK